MPDRSGRQLVEWITATGGISGVTRKFSLPGSMPWSKRIRSASSCTSPSPQTGPCRHASPPDSSQIPASSAATGHTSTVIPIFSSTAGLLFLPLLFRLDDLPGAGLGHADPLRERRERQLLLGA